MLLRRSHYVVKHRRCGKKPEVLESSCYSKRDDLISLKPVYVFSLKFDLSARYVVYSGHKVEYRRLSCAVGSNKASQFTCLDDKGHILDSLHSSERLIYIFKFKYRGHQRTPPSSAVIFFLRVKMLFM